MKLLIAFIEDWLTKYPKFSQTLQIFAWSVNHPIISLGILLLAIALSWSIIKGIVRLIQIASLSILKFPFKLLQFLIKIGFKTFHNINNLPQQKNVLYSKIHNNSELITINVTEKYKHNKQQRLSEIYHRLQKIQDEQQQLLEEATKLIASETTDIEIREIKLNNIIANSTERETTV